jgi:S1-C subfamily serine protease
VLLTIWAEFTRPIVRTGAAHTSGYISPQNSRPPFTTSGRRKFRHRNTLNFKVPVTTEDDRYAESWGLRSSKGVYVEARAPQADPYSAVVEPGDVIASFNGVPIEGGYSVAERTAEYRA